MINAEISSRTIQMMKATVSETFLIPINEIPRILFHGLFLACIISGFWLLDSLKDPILANTTGIKYQPVAKFFSVITTLFVVSVYDYLTSIVSKLTLFHILSWTFGFIILIMSALLSDPIDGLSSPDRGPHRLIGWFCYFTVEAYGSLMVALFWSFTNSVMDLEQAKGAYGLIIAIAQLGAILGSTFATNAEKYGISQLYLLGSITIFSISLIIKVYCIIYNDKSTQSVMLDVSISDLPVPEPMSPIKLKSRKRIEDVSYKLIHLGARVGQGFYEGLLLIAKYSYILKILGVSCLYEIIVTILDYQFKIIGAQHFSINESIKHIDEGRFANLLGHFGQFTNLLSFIVSLFGFSILTHRLGVRYSLLIFPIVLFITIILINLYPSLNVYFVLMSIVKALIFSLHDPVKELLYNPTSNAIKFKAKAWIDVFGSRLAKAAGSFITNLGDGDLNYLRNISEIPCLILSMIIIGISWSAGSDFQHYIENHIVIGENTGLTIYEVESLNLPVRNGLKPGDVGYDGYDLHLFEGVFTDDKSLVENNNNDKINNYNNNNNNRRRTQSSNL